jgi:hypothetical protein
MAASGKATKGVRVKHGADKYLDFLAEEGYRPSIDDNGDVAFKCEGRRYVIEIDENDEEYFCLAYPDFWSIESDEELSQVMEAAVAVTADSKVVKIYPVEDTDTWATIELFCSPPETFKTVFDRCLSALRAGVEKFVAKMEEQPEQSDDFVFHLPRYNVGSN